MRKIRKPSLSIPRRDPWREYEHHKELWRALHPDATAEQYAHAMREIARKLGL